MLKKKLMTLMLATAMVMGTSALCFAEETAAKTEIANPNATNFSAPYPTTATLPALPVKPESNQ